MPGRLLFFIYIAFICIVVRGTNRISLELIDFEFLFGPESTVLGIIYKENCESRVLRILWISSAVSSVWFLPIGRNFNDLAVLIFIALGL